jgi:Rab3 GTPase-activating protein catalytic subunit
MLDPVATGQTRGVQAQARSCIQRSSNSSDDGVQQQQQQQQQQCFTEQQRLCPYPDMRLCLTAQKLQLLNCCIEQRLGKLLDSSSSSTDATADTGSANTADTADASTDLDDTTTAAGVDTTTTATATASDTADAAHGDSITASDAAQAVAEEADDDDEFFDSRDATSALPSPAQSPRYAHHLTTNSSGSNTVNGSALVEPVLPQLCPLTSDMLPEHTAAAPRLLAAVAAADAAAFKNANPGAKQKDFVNWYCNSSGSSTSTSSSRQQLQTVARTAAAEVWNKGSTRAQQHRALFDVAQEAEKALHHLVSNSTTALSVHLSYCFTQSSETVVVWHNAGGLSCCCLRRCAR